MTRQMLAAVLVILFAFSGRTSAQAPVRDSATTPAGTSSIRGRVVATDTGSALRVARIALSSEGAFQARSVVTDDEGRYEFKGLPEGRYSLSASKETYVTLAYGQTRPSQGGRFVALGQNQSVENVNFGLPKGGVIAGTVVDEFGDPVASVSVGPMQTSYKEGRRSLIAAGPTEATDDLGQFRLSGLPPGSYYVQVRKLTTGIPVGAVIRSSLSYVPVFAPGTPNLTDARRVVIDLGQTVSGVDVAMVRVPSVSITATIVDASGQPARWGLAMLVQPGVYDPAPRTAEQGLNPGITQGFTFSAVPRGTYEVRATSNGQLGALPAGTAPVAAVGTVTVNGENITNLPLRAVAISRISGRVVAAAETALPKAQIGVGTRSGDPTQPLDWVAQFRPAPLAPDLTFSVYALPGRWILTPSPPAGFALAASLPKGWGLKAVRLAGVDVTDTGIEVREGVDVRDVEVELTNHPPEVSGSVRGPKGEVIDDYTVLLFAKDRARWNGNPRYFAMARPDQSGKFAVGTLAPGEYYAIALEYVDVNEAQDPELLARVTRDASSFTLAEAEQKILDLRIVP